MNKKKAALLLISILTSVALADTTVVEVRVEKFPYDQEIRVFIDRGSVYLRCRDAIEFVDYGPTETEEVDPEKLLSVFIKLVKWIELNKQVKVNVTKFLEIDDVRISYRGHESGNSSVRIVSGKACFVRQNHIERLIRGIENNLNNAKSEDEKHKEDLFQ